MNRFLWPLIGFIVLVVLLAVGLNLNPRDVPFAAGRQAGTGLLAAAPRRAGQRSSRPGHARQGLAAQRLGIVVCLVPTGASGAGRTGETADRAAGRSQLQGSPRRRRDRHRQGGPGSEKRWSSSVPAAWLAQHGDPYTLSVLDIDGRVGIDYGVYGVPETYVIDKAGIIRMKHTGPITPDVFSGKILPLLAELSK
jgi:cytochrome c biogenesis protein CcmG/thiol:disulfide interchange protein DsbE